jgi:hypothetical protein
MDGQVTCFSGQRPHSAILAADSAIFSASGGHLKYWLSITMHCEALDAACK